MFLILESYYLLQLLTFSLMYLAVHVQESQVLCVCVFYWKVEFWGMGYAKIWFNFFQLFFFFFFYQLSYTHQQLAYVPVG